MRNLLKVFADLKFPYKLFMILLTILVLGSFYEVFRNVWHFYLLDWIKGVLNEL